MLIHKYADVLNTPNIYYNRGLIQSVLRGLIFVVWCVSLLGFAFMTSLLIREYIVIRCDTIADMAGCICCKCAAQGM